MIFWQFFAHNSSKTFQNSINNNFNVSDLVFFFNTELEISNIIKKYYEDSSLRLKIGKEASKFVLKCHTYKNRVEQILKDKIIIIDEAHNIRNSAKLEEKRIYSAIVNAIKTGINNKLILLTATPMYNEPTDILDLLYLFLLNDKIL